MPRWKALPEELDPEVREFADQLRRLVDRSGLGIAAVADRTGYSRTSWERYLNGRLLAPKGAIVALAEVTGANPVHLITLWELAERAWSRSEMRHDMTMEAIQISQARAALGEFGGAPDEGRGKRGARTSVAEGRDAPRGHAAAPGAPGHGGYPGAVPQQRGAGDASDAYAHQGHGPVPPRTAPQRPGRGGDGRAPGRHGAPGGTGGGKRKVTLFLAGVVGALLVIAAAVLLLDLGGDEKEPRAKTPPPAPASSTPVEPPADVKCTGAKCTGQDPETMGCGGQYARTVSRATVGTATVEVRYSETCSASWARLTKAAPGAKVTVEAAGKTGNGTVNAGKDAYTPMVAVKAAADAKACATLASGTKGCTDG
ncbi:DUF2690 domain-containing protein [Streptomyces sp. NPDC050504]|uniref:DUF2690 domain-containing protein n=1 Tax=Streptomyces sp. NPDC050504 TaxID=3365618 RepID=UPI00379B90E7